MGKGRRRKKRKPAKDKPQKQPPKPIYRDSIWEKSKLGALGPRVHNEKFECFECVRKDCKFEFRLKLGVEGMAADLNFPCQAPACCICGKDPCKWEWCSACRKLSQGRPCTNGSCPKCGSIYVMWLSYDIKSEDVWFSSEWFSGERVWNGSATIRHLGNEQTHIPSETPEL